MPSVMARFLLSQRYKPGLATLAWLSVSVALSPIGVQGSDALSAKALNAAGVRALSSGKLDEALRDFKQAQQVDSGNTAIAFNIGLTCIRIGRYQDAIAPLRRASAAPGAAVKTHYLLAVSLYEVSDFKAAAAELQPFENEVPEHQDEVLYLLEESYRRGREPAMAKQAFSKLMLLYPDSPLVHKLMGIAYDEQGDPVQAMAEFKRAVTLDPRTQDVHLAIGLLYLNARDEKAATEWLQQEVALNPCQPAAHYYLGEIDRRAGLLGAATAQFRKATNCDSDFADAHIGLGLIFEGKKQPAEAVKEMQTATRLAPDSREAHYQLARVLMKTGQKQAAQSEFQRVRILSETETEKSIEKLNTTRDEVKVSTVIR